MQEILMRVISKHITPLDRQISESLNIAKASTKPEECLNLKSEWGGSKLPSLLVSVPKGVGGGRPGPGNINEDSQETGDKRFGEINVLEKEEEVRPGKRRRCRSPQGGKETWNRNPKPTFEGKKYTGRQERQGGGITCQETGLGKGEDQETGRQKRLEEQGR